MRSTTRSQIALWRVLPLLPGIVLMLAVAGVEGAEVAIEALGSASGWVYASTAQGIYRARSDRGEWEKVPTPKSLPPSGRFSRHTDAEGGLYYHALRTFQPGPNPGDAPIPVPGAPGADYGLFRTVPGSGSWEKIPGEYGFLHVLADGRRLFALVNSGENPAEIPWVIESTTRGANWHALPPLPPNGGMPVELFPDPDHPGQVCVKGHGLRGMILQAADARYEWQVEREPAWQRRQPPADPWHPGSDPSAGGIPLVPATLENYFAVPAGFRAAAGGPGAPVQPGLWMETGTNRVFAVGEEVKLAVRIRTVPGASLPARPARKLVDVPETEDLWFLTGFGLGGQALVTPPRRSPNEVRRDPGWKATPFGPGSSQERIVHLSRMTSFAAPGRYRVQVVYDSQAVSGKRKDEWAIQLVSRELEIEVK